MKSRGRLIALALALALGISAATAGCSGGTPAAEQTPAKTVTVTVTAEPSSQTPSPSADRTALPDVTSLGSTYRLPGQVNVKVLRYRNNVRGVNGPKRGQRLDSVLVRTCVVRKKTTLSWYPWSLETKDSSSYPATSETYGGWPIPEYPFAGDRVFRRGECVKGWISFYVTGATQVARVVYAVDEGTHRWRLRATS